MVTNAMASNAKKPHATHAARIARARKVFLRILIMLMAGCLDEPEFHVSSV